MKSVRIKEVAPAADTAAPSDSAASKWKIPAGWKTLAAGQMQAAKFAVPDVGAAKAEVTISISPSDTGGLLANIRRWRGQIGSTPTLIGTSGIVGGHAIIDDLVYNNTPAAVFSLKKSGITWSRQTLDSYLADPQKVVPANRMPYAGMPEAKDRADLLDYMQAAFK